MQFEEHEGHVREGIDRILRRVGRLKAGNDRICKQLVEKLQLDWHNYLRQAFAALEILTTTHRGPFGASVHTAATNITDGLKAMIETVEALRCPFISGSSFWFSSTLLFYNFFRFFVHTGFCSLLVLFTLRWFFVFLSTLGPG